GLPTDERTGDFVRVIREDPKQKGLLVCGTETTVYVSFDDGDQWQSLRLNLPTTSIRDMTFHTGDHMNDLVIGTYGRSFWVLDDMSPLREVATHAQGIASAPAYLFKPGDAIRARQNINWDTPFPPEVPEASNPPFGALIYYHLGQAPAGEVKLQIYDSAGSLVRTLSSVAAPANQPPPPVPSYWLATPESLALPAAAGTNRAHWDLRYDDPPAVSHDIENQMFALPHQTTYGPHGPLALPGTYTVKLTAGGQTYSQPLVVRNDPRIGESPAILAALRSQHRLEMLAYQAMKDSYAGNAAVAALRAQVLPLTENSAIAGAAHALQAKLTTFGGTTGGGRGGRGRGGAPAPGALVAFSQLNAGFSSLISPVTRDMAATQPQIQAWEGYCQEYNRTVTAWNGVQSQDVAGFNSLLRQNGLQPLTVEATKLGDPSCRFAAPAAGK
ncbi:MAG: hypothetical protein ACRD1L_14280, partial [Terriglobales bacterium]